MPTWKKGQSGNPNGRPPKSRTLSIVLAQKADDLVLLNPDDARTYKEVVADLLWQFATTGKVDLPDGTLHAETVTDWLNAVRWIYTHIDGPSPTQAESADLVITIERITTLSDDT